MMTRPMARRLDALLDQLEQHKSRADEYGQGRWAQLITETARQKFADAQSLARFHDVLLFLRGFPPSLSIARQVEALLAGFAERIEKLKNAGEDLSSIED